MLDRSQSKVCTSRAWVNRASGRSGASATAPSNGLIIRGNTVENTVGAGIELSQTADAIIERNTLLNNGGINGTHNMILSNAGSDRVVLFGTIESSAVATPA
ncbi:MAG: hypothetical protein R3C68_17000 [Myxococcota bacterium]